MSGIVTENTVIRYQFDCKYKTLTEMNAQSDLIDVNLNKKYDLIDRIIDWFKRIVNQNEISYQNNCMTSVSEKLFNFVQENKDFLTELANEAKTDPKHKFHLLIKNIKTLCNRFVMKHRDETEITKTHTYHYLDKAAQNLEAMLRS